MADRRALVLVAVAAVLVAGCAAPGGDSQRREAPAPGGATPTAAPGGGADAPDPEDGGTPVGAATATPAAGEVPVPEVTVRLNCTRLRVTVTPDAWHYRLYLRYRDTVTGKQRRIAAGIFTGTVTDHFGPTDFVLVAVEVRVTGFPPVLRTRPTRCSG